MGSNCIERDVSQKRFMTKNIAARVTQGLEAYEDTLRLRRRKLKLMIDEEDNVLYRELKIHEKLKIDLIIQMQRDKVEAMEKQKAKEKEDLMARRQLQIDMAKCKDIQPLLRRRRELETQQVQQQQMKEMEEKKNHEREINNMWFYIMKNDSEAKREKAEKEQFERYQSEIERKKCLDAQVQIAKESQRKKDLAAKQEMDTFMVGVKKNTEKIISIESQKINDAKMMLNESLKLQISSREENLKKAKDQEEALESSRARMCIMQHEEELQKKLADKANQRRQLEIYGQHASAIKAEREAREKAEDLMVAEVAQKQCEESEKQRILLAQKSKALLKDAMVGRDMQMEEKRKAAEAAARNAAEEMETRQRKEKQMAEQWKQDKERDAKAKVAYKQYLEEQMELSKIAKETEKSRLMADFKNKLIKEKEFNERMVHLMKQEFGSEGVHPFMKAMNIKSQTEKSPCPRAPRTSIFKF